MDTDLDHLLHRVGTGSSTEHPPPTPLSPHPPNAWDFDPVRTFGVDTDLDHLLHRIGTGSATDTPHPLFPPIHPLGISIALEPLGWTLTSTTYYTAARPLTHNHSGADSSVRTRLHDKCTQPHRSADQVVAYGHGLVTLPLANNETLRRVQRRFRWWQCGARCNFPHILGSRSQPASSSPETTQRQPTSRPNERTNVHRLLHKQPLCSEARIEPGSLCL